MSTKVFVGNLAFKITSEQLRDEFSVAGNVLSANIISRGPRSLGYGFVEFASREDAEKSVTLLNHKAIDGREINVEVAKPRADLPEREKRQPQDGQEGEERQRPPRRPRKPRNNNPGGNTTTTTTTTSTQTQPGGRRMPQGGAPGGRTNMHGGPAPRRMYKPRYQDNAGDNDVQAQGGNAPRNFNNNFNDTFTNNGDSGQRPFRPRRRRTNPTRGGYAGQEQLPPQQPPQQSQQPQFRRKQQERRPPQQPRKQQERISSPTTLFVANLPFSVEDKELAEIFSKWKVVKAHVVRKRNTRSKGFGFVEFDNEADQQAALKEFDGFTLHERVLNVKVALTSIPGAEEDDNAGEAQKPAAEGGAEKQPQAEEKGAAAAGAGAAAGGAPAAAEPKAEAKEASKPAEAPAAAAATEGGAAEEKKGGQ